MRVCMDPIPYVDLRVTDPALEEELLDAVRQVFRHGKFVMGPEVEALEAQLAEYTGARYAVGVNSGTDALIFALRAYGVGPGDEVITVSHSFVATSSAIAITGARPVFVDIDRRTMLLDPWLLESALTPRTAAVLPVHLNGYPCAMDEIAAFCERHGLALIEDCAQAIGCRYRGKKHVGTFGAGCFSLHPLKILAAAGDAGFITTDEADVARQARFMRNLGLRDRDHCEIACSNSRLDTIQAAILLVKMRHFESWIARRNQHAEAYRQALKNRVELPPEHDGHEPVYSSFVIRHPERDRLMAGLKQRGVSVKIHYPVPIHRQPAFADFDMPRLPATNQTVDQIISLPVHQSMTDDMRDRVIEAVLELT